MPVSVWPALIEQLREVPDPRVERTQVHPLIDILTIAICAMICGAEGWDDFVSFGRAKQDWLKEKLGLELPAMSLQRKPVPVVSRPSASRQEGIIASWPRYSSLFRDKIKMRRP